ncbi:Piezo-type mechanosensitive ion channel component [Galdieria sulphuraria]|nr:Piezo-type mechanosensitive ion channel component [Galdieria sulphuraria]
MDVGAGDSPRETRQRSELAEVPLKNKGVGSNEVKTSEKEMDKTDMQGRESLSESTNSGWSSELNRSVLEEMSKSRKIELLCKTLTRWIGCGVLLTASLLRFSVLSLPYFLLFLFSFLHVTKSYFQYYVAQKSSIVLLGMLSVYSFGCFIFEVVMAALLGTGKYVPTTTALRSLESIGIADFQKSIGTGLRGLLPDIFVFVFAVASLGVNWFLWKSMTIVHSTLSSEQRSPRDYVSRRFYSSVTVFVFYSFLLLVSITFASVVTCIIMLFVDLVLLAWALGPITFARWKNRLIEDERLKGANYYERRLLAQVPPSFPDKLIGKILSALSLKHMDLTLLKIRVTLVIDLFLLVYVTVLYIFQWPWLSGALLSNVCRVIGIVPLGHSNAPQWPYNLTFALAICCFCTGGLFIEGNLIIMSTVSNDNSISERTTSDAHDVVRGTAEEQDPTERFWDRLFFSESNALSIAYQVVPFLSNLSIVIWALVFPGALSTVLLVVAGFYFLFPNLINRTKWLVLMYMMCIVVATNLYNAVPTADISIDSQKQALEAGLKRADTTIWVMAIEMFSVVLVVLAVRLYHQVGRRRAFLNSELRRHARSESSEVVSSAFPLRFSKWTKFFVEDVLLDQVGLKEGRFIDWRDSQDADSILVFLVWFAVPLEACAMISLFASAGVIVNAVDSVFLIILGIAGLLYLLPVSRFQKWLRLISWNLALFYQIVVLVMNGCICRFMSGGAHCHISGGINGSELSALFAYVVFLCIGSLQVLSVRMRYLKKFCRTHSLESSNGITVISGENSYHQTFGDSKLPYALSVINEFFRFSWLYICYILLIADALLFPGNYLAFAYLLMAFILLVIEMVISVRVEPRQVVRRVWFVIVLFSAAIVALRYIVRFRSIYLSLSPDTAHAVIRAGIDAGIGFQIGDVIVFIACVLQARLFGKHDSVQSVSLRKRLMSDSSRKHGFVLRVLSVLTSFISTLFIWSSRLVLVIMVLISSIWLSGVSALSYVYIFLCVIILLFESEAKYNYVLELKMSLNSAIDRASENVEARDRTSSTFSVGRHQILSGIVFSKHVSSVWTATLLALYSFAVICVQLFYIVWVFEGHSRWNAAYWLGLASGPRSVPIGSKRMAGNILILVFSVLHRLAQRRTLKHIEENADREASDDVRKNHIGDSTFYGTNSMMEPVQDQTDVEDRSSSTVKFMTKASQLFFSLHRVWLRSCIDVTFVYLMMSAVIVRTIVSLIYTLLVALLLVPSNRWTTRRFFWFPAWVLSVLLIIQYAVSLGLWPPESYIVHWPWLDLSVTWQRWFFVDVGFRGYDWSLALTFGGLILCALVLDVEREEKLKKKFAVEEQNDEPTTAVFPFSSGNVQAVRFFQFFGSIGFGYFVLTYTFAAATSLPNVMTYIFILFIFIVIWKFKWFVLPPYFFWRALLFYTLFVLFVELLVQFPFSLGNPSTSWESILGCYKAYTKHGTQFFILLLFLFTFLLLECRINESIHSSILKPGIQRLHMKRFLLAMQDYTVRYFRNRELFRVLDEDREARKTRLHRIKEIRANREKKLREEENVLNPLGEETFELDEMKLKEAETAQKKMSNDDELFAMQLSAPEAPAPGEVTDALQGGVSQWRSIKEFASQTASTLRSGAATRSVLSRNSLSRPSMSVRDSVPLSTRIQQVEINSVGGPQSPVYRALHERSPQIPEDDPRYSPSKVQDTNPREKPKLFRMASTEAANDNTSVGYGYVDFSALDSTNECDQGVGSVVKKLSLDDSVAGGKERDMDGIDFMTDTETTPVWLQSPFISWLKFLVGFLFIHSDWVVYFFMVFAFLMNRTLLTFVYVMYLFLFLFVEWPRPRRIAWMCLLTYTEAVIVFKLVVLLPALANPSIGVAASSCGTGVFFDVLILFSTLLRRLYLWSQGLWDVDVSIEEITNNDSSCVEGDSKTEVAKNGSRHTGLFSKVLHPFKASEQAEQPKDEAIFMSDNVVNAALREGIFLQQDVSQQNGNDVISSNYTATATSSVGNGPYILAQNISANARASLKVAKICFGTLAPRRKIEYQERKTNENGKSKRERKLPSPFLFTIQDSDGFYMRSEVWIEFTEVVSTETAKENEILQKESVEEIVPEDRQQESSSSSHSHSTFSYSQFDLKDSIKFETEGKIAEMQQPKNKAAEKLRKLMPSFIFQYFQRILCTDGVKPGADYYLLSFTVDFICLLYMLFLFPLMFAPADARVAVTETAWWSTNLMSLKQILTLLALFAGLIMERIFYLRRLMLGKLILYYANVIVFHLVIFVIGDFDQRATLIVFYVLKLISFVLGGLQVREGFPPYTHGQFLLRRFSAWGMFFFNLYYMTPFLYELRTILDWTMIPTSMECFDWMKYSDIWISLYRNKAMNNNRAWQKRWLGKKRIASVKFWLGAMLVLLLSFLLWIPFIVFSAINPFEAYQPIENGRLSVSLSSGSQLELYQSVIVSPSIATSAERSFASNLDVSLLADTNQGKTYWLEFGVDSNQIWQPPVHRITTLESQLLSGQIQLLAALSIESGGGYTYQYVSSSVLNVTERTSLSDSLHSKNTYGIHVPSFLPRYLAVDSTTSSSGLSVLGNGNENACIKVVFENVTREGVLSNGTSFVWNETQTYWQVASCNASGVDCFKCSNGISLKDESQTSGSGASFLITGYVVFVRSGSSGGVLGKFAAGGILALVVYIFFSIGGMVRRMFENEKIEIPYYYMPFTDNLLSLVYDIIRARQDGDLAMEEFLFWELIDLYRSQERLVKWSGERQLYPEFEWWLPPFRLQRWTMYKQCHSS